MFLDIGAASSFLSTLALFASTTNFGKNCHIKSTNFNSCNRQSAFLSRPNDAPSRAFEPSVTALNSEFIDRAGTINDPMVPKRVKQEKYVALLKWLGSNGASINDCLEVRQSSQGEQAGYGVFINRPVEQGELLFSIPRNLCVTIEKATTSVDDDGTFGDGLQNIVDKAGPGGSTVAMAGYMAKEFIMMYLDERDNTPDNDPSTNSNNRWGPYMELLPWRRGINNQEHVLFWNEAKIEELLRGSLCYPEARSLRQEVALSIQVLGPLLKRSVQMARGELSTDPLERLNNLLPWNQFNKQESDLTDILDDKLIGDAIKGAFVTLLTRSFADDKEEEKQVEGTGEEDNDGNNEDDDTYSEKLVPLLDLLQHSDAPNVRHRVVGFGMDATVEVRARRDIDSGSELWNQYRSEEDEAMPYSRFFTRYVGNQTGSTIHLWDILLDVLFL